MAVFLGVHNIVSPLGYSSKKNFESLLSEKSALRVRTFGFSDTAFCCSKLEEASLDRAFLALGDPEQYTRLEKMCILSIQEVVTQSKTDLGDEGTLLIISTTKGNIDLLENRHQTISLQRAYLHQFANTLGGFFKSKHTPLVVSNACISGLLALIIGGRLLEHKKYRQIIVCGGDIVSEFTLSGFKSFNALSATPCKPFDAARAGINLGEAAASILISAREISDLVLYSGASSNDATHISAPSRSGDGLYQAIEQTFKKLDPKEVDFISAHGTATEYNDDMESVALSKAGLNALPTNSLKGYFGHTLGAAGLLESIVALQSLTENILVKSAGFQTAGTVQPVNIITEWKKQELHTCLKTASGFGGCNAAAIFKKI